MTLPARPGEAPLEGLLGRRVFAVAPWLAVGFSSAAYTASQLLRGVTAPTDGGTDWLITGLAAGLAVVSFLMAPLQDRPVGLRHRRTLWVYALFGTVVAALVAFAASVDHGPSSIVFAGLGPIAVYSALVTPPSWRLRVLGVLLAAIAFAQVADPTPAFDLVVIVALIVASWFSGVLTSTAHARTVKLARRLGRYDAATRSLNRRGFMEQLEHVMSPLETESTSVALLVVGIDLASATEPDDEPSRLLRWVGSAVPALLPPDAEFGRIGNGEFGILVTGVGRANAAMLAEEIERALAVRVPTTVGVATTETRLVTAADLFRVADAARGVARREGLRTHSLVAGTLGDARPSIVPGTRPTLRYADLRNLGRLRSAEEDNRLPRRIAGVVLLVVAAAGVPVIARQFFSDGTGFAADLVTYGGLPWVIAVTGMAAATWRWVLRDRPWIEVLLLLSSAFTISWGMAAAALATGGLLSPILFALFVKTIFDSTALPHRHALVSLASVVTGWLIVASFSPPETLWAVPFQLAMIGGSYAFGRISRSSMRDTALFARNRAYTDDLTQFSNRAGFVNYAEEAFFRSVTETGQPFALITFQLDGLRDYNETHGYAAGDAMLRTVADLLEERIPSYYVIGRTGATTFSAAVPVAGSLAATGLAHDLCAAIGAHTSVRAGCATCPADGATLAALMETSERDARARSVAA